MITICPFNRFFFVQHIALSIFWVQISETADDNWHNLMLSVTINAYAFNNNQQFTLICVFVYFALFVYM